MGRKVCGLGGQEVFVAARFTILGRTQTAHIVPREQFSTWEAADLLLWCKAGARLAGQRRAMGTGGQQYCTDSGRRDLETAGVIIEGYQPKPQAP